VSKPSEFYVGVLDFFAILLPGAVATAILAPRFGPMILGPLVAVPTSGAAGWVAFLICSYFLVVLCHRSWYRREVFIVTVEVRDG
jgi:membrane associated rhomboid family serine protease